MKLQTVISILRQFGLKNCLFRIGYQRRKKSGYFEQVNPTFDWETLSAGSIFLPGEVSASDSLRSYLNKKTGRFFFELGKPIRLSDHLTDDMAAESATNWQSDAVRRADLLIEGQFTYFFKQEGKLGEPGSDGLEVDWFLNPFTGQRDTQMVHWSRRGDFDPNRGDIKYIWEPSRFAWVYDLVRAYSATGDDRYPTLFWHLLKSWMQANPASIGPGWQCGQEAAIRVMAVCFGLWAFFDHPTSDEKNLLQATRLLATLGARIEVNLDYAKSQRSNHSSTEALGLLMLGLLFPTMRGADRWLRLGRETLEHDARHHFWSDGSYLMHSLNYQRMTMHCFLWAMRLAELADAPFPDDVYETMARATRFLHQLQDDSGCNQGLGIDFKRGGSHNQEKLQDDSGRNQDVETDSSRGGSHNQKKLKDDSGRDQDIETDSSRGGSHNQKIWGRVPNYGSNDGALICPLSGCDYLDYRPLLAAMFRLTERKPVSPVACDKPVSPVACDGFIEVPVAGDRANKSHAAPSQEETLWLFGTAEEICLPERRSSQFPVGGYYTLRSERSWLMTRCHTYRNRPSQADQLHVDLWYAGMNVLRDLGTFQYYDPELERNLHFISTVAHNTIEVNGQSQMEKGPRFYWNSLCRGRLIQADETSIIAEHYGYRRFGVTHRREIRLIEPDRWQIKDRLIGGNNATRWKLSFHLLDVGCSFDGAAGLTIPLSVKAERSGASRRPDSSIHLNWQSEAAITPELLDAEESLYYGHLSPVKLLTLSGSGGNAEIIWNVFWTGASAPL